jgi:hypothetical protein
VLASWIREWFPSAERDERVERYELETTKAVRLANREAEKNWRAAWLAEYGKPMEDE